MIKDGLRRSKVFTAFPVLGILGKTSSGYHRANFDIVVGGKNKLSTKYTLI